MCNTIKIIILLILFLFVGCAHGNGNELSKLNKITENVKNAVLSEDSDALMKYVSSSGTTFIDNSYSNAQINNLINDQNSWLYKHLFVSENSVKNYLKNAKNLEINVSYRSDNAVFVSYQSSNYEPVEWVENCFIKIDGKWYFDGIFSCD